MYTSTRSAGLSNAPYPPIQLDSVLSQTVSDAARSVLRTHLSDSEISQALTKLWAWTDQREAEFRPHAWSLRRFQDSAIVQKLISSLPSDFVNEVLIAKVEGPLPMVRGSDLGVPQIPEHAPFEGGLALRSLCALTPLATTGTLAHEVAHLVQLRLLGDEAFGLSYLADEVKGIYRASVLEKSAHIAAASIFQAGIEKLDFCALVKRSLTMPLL